MARLKRINTKERRSSRRIPASEVIPQNLTRLVTGQEVRLINISCNGAILIQSDIVLSPGAYVRLKLKVPGSLLNLEGQVRRCRVIGLKQQKVKYEAAIILDGSLPEPLVEKLQFFEKDLQSETPSLQDLNLGAMPYPNTAELWVLNAQEA